jgi:phage tail-like protein
MADTPKAEPVKYWKIQADGLEIGMFYEHSGAGMSIQATKFPVWDGNGKPLPLPVGVQPSFGDITLSRAVDTENAFFEWISLCGQKGAEAAKKQVTLIGMDSDGNPIQTYKLTDAWPTHHQPAGYSAGGNGTLTESLTFSYTDMQINEKGGLTGPTA